MFINIEDLKTLKFQHILDNILEDNNDIAKDLIEMAIAEVSAYLGSKYDVETIFNQTGSKRHPTIKRLTIDFFLCFAFERVSGNEIPDYLAEKCSINRKFLTDLASGKLNIYNLPKLSDTLEQTANIKFASEQKFVNY